MKRETLTIISGAIWFVIGCMLMNVGFKLMADPSLGLIAAALVVGYLKGKFILRKTAHRVIAHINAQPSPLKLYHIYDKKTYILIGSMMVLGMGIKWLGIPNEVRAFVDIAVGAGLLNGSMVYFSSRFSTKPVS